MKIIEYIGSFENLYKIYNYDFFTKVSIDYKIIVYLVVPNNTIIKYKKQNKLNILYKISDIKFDKNFIIREDPTTNFPENYIGTYWPKTKVFTTNQQYKGPYNIEILLNNV